VPALGGWASGHLGRAEERRRDEAESTELDLDHLANEISDILRWRLLAERERMMV
jgi:hypothetical protein